MENRFEMIMITGLNGYVFIVGKGSIVHDYAKAMHREGVKCELIEANYHYGYAANNVDKLVIYTGQTFDKSKIATNEQRWAFSRYYINNYRQPVFPTQGVSREMCA
jgi:hypothetical protein